MRSSEFYPIFSLTVSYRSVPTHQHYYNNVQQLVCGHGNTLDDGMSRGRRCIAAMATIGVGLCCEHSHCLLMEFFKWIAFRLWEHLSNDGSVFHP